MVKPVTSFGRSGLADWLIQRFSAVVLLAFTLCVTGWLLVTPNIDYVSWQDYMGSTAMRIFALLALLSVVAHASIGLWAVSTDYLTTRLLGAKGTALRLLFQAAYTLVLFVYLVWGIEILWGQ
jgi:succinate dehydrogenase / fumarate reductase membrane anchor subunit